ncbi:hypothetical protein C1J03_11765 [Sulfitobacter sp. SK012]|nr:hypothetical protein C1J03_11765 [Sulfitobacter sp. SK012]
MIKLPISWLKGGNIYLKDESTHPTRSLKHHDRGSTEFSTSNFTAYVPLMENQFIYAGFQCVRDIGDYMKG